VDDEMMLGLGSFTWKERKPTPFTNAQQCSNSNYNYAANKHIKPHK
jgi:hypothetical protein